MCGLTGFLSADGSDEEELALYKLRNMADAIVHRGPNSEGYWIDQSSGIGLAHRRLAIVDLTPAGQQPMASPSGRYVIAFNGEIYNHLHLRDLLHMSGLVTPWRGHSDTETLLAGFDIWGIEKTLQRSVGMFAMAVWDRQERLLTLARDRVGEKPLYYGWQGQGNQKIFLFGSELSALRKHQAFTAEINRNALALFMRHNCIGGDHSIYSGIQKLAPGHILTVSLSKPEPVARAWWSLANVAAHGFANSFSGTPDEAVDALETLLCSAVSHQMMADVPIGAFLSGGIDSSLIVALMQKLSSSPVRTFSIGFHEADYNEAQYAKAVAQHLGTNHTELYISPQEALAIVPKLPTLYSEPFADSSQIPTFIVSQLASQHVRVSLSGDAGDELFCGYTRYQLTASLWRKLSQIPLPLRQLTSNLLKAMSPGAWDKLGRVFPASLGTHVGDKLHKGAELLNSSSSAALYRDAVSHWADPASVVLGANEPATMTTRLMPVFKDLDDVERMMLLDMLSYLPDDILVKIDRAAMGVSLETRVPFLDHRVVEFAWSLPLDYKLRNGVAKWPLRQVLHRYVPPGLIERPKMGFGVPIEHWLRGPLREWAESLLSESRLQQEGFFNPEPIRRKWAEHLSGRRNCQYLLWDVLMFQAWLEAQRV